MLENVEAMFDNMGGMMKKLKKKSYEENTRLFLEKNGCYFQEMTELMDGAEEKEKMAGVMGKLRAAAGELRELNKGDLEIARTFLQINGGIMPEAAPSRGLDTYQAAKRFGADGGFEQKI